MKSQVEDKRLITQAEYARLKGLSRARISQMVKAQKLTCVWIRGSKLILLTAEEMEELDNKCVSSHSEV